jgi:hypothetical protein
MKHIHNTIYNINCIYIENIICEYSPSDGIGVVNFIILIFVHTVCVYACIMYILTNKECACAMYAGVRILLSDSLSVHPVWVLTNLRTSLYFRT